MHLERSAGKSPGRTCPPASPGSPTAGTALPQSARALGRLVPFTSFFRAFYKLLLQMARYFFETIYI